jgi:membrane-associated protease RseP (regulator of RpoE activity)
MCLDGYLLTLIVLLVWFAILLLGWKTKFWEKIHFQVYGPFLMVKTVRGKQFIDRIARRARLWTAYGRISIGVTIGSMIALMVLLIWEAFLVTMISASQAPSPEMLLGLPGINPLIPLWYGILGLVVAIFVHEFAHGILSRVAKIKIESMGILLLIVPMGAFVEPNEEQIRNTTRANRSRLYAAGPATNIFVAFICLVILVCALAPSARPISDGAVVVSTVPDSPAEKFGISPWSEIINIDAWPISNTSSLSRISFGAPGSPYNITILYNGNQSKVMVPGGVVLSQVYAGLPAHNAGLKRGMIIESLNDTIIHDLDDFHSVVENASHMSPVNISVLEYGFVDSVAGKYWFVKNQSITNITLTSKWLYYETNFPEDNREEYKNISYMGVTSTIFGIGVQNPDYVISKYSKPFDGQDLVTSSLKLIAMPFMGITPVEGPMAALYEPTGALSVLPGWIYWILFNSFYWVFWINLMVGLTNALPALPLDGGFVFRDIIKGFVVRARRKRGGLDKIVTPPMSDEELDRIVGAVTLLISVFVLFLIIWQIIGPRI